MHLGLLCIFLFLSNLTIAQDLIFDNLVLQSGTDKQIGAVYKQTLAAPGIDAVVTIVDLTGGTTLDSFDDNGTGNVDAFQPKVVKSATLTDEYARFQFDFFVTGTGTPVSVTNAEINAVDVDGCCGLYEYSTFYGCDSYTLDNPTALSAVEVAGGWRFEGPYGGPSGIDYSATDYIAKVNYNSIQSFIMDIGADGMNAWPNRQASIYFKSIAFTSPKTAITCFSSPIFWLKANVEVMTGASPATDGGAVNTWKDQSGMRTNDATDANLAPPTFRNNSSDNINFNPVVEFDGVDDGLDLFDDYIYSSGSGSEDGMTWFCIVQADASTAKSRQFIYDFGRLNNKGYGFIFSDDNCRIWTATDDGGVATNYNHSRDIFPCLNTVQIDFGNNQTLSLNGNTLVINDAITLTQLDASTINEKQTHASDEGPFTIGQQSKTGNISNDGGRYFDGKIAEIIAYNKVLTSAQKQELESYLAIKYGLSLAHNYYDSQGNLLKDVNDGFSNAIAIVGRDDAIGLHQEKSRSKGDALNIICSAQNLTDFQFASISHNGKSDDISLLLNLNQNEIIASQRTWKIESRSDVVQVNLQLESRDEFDLILISSEPDFQDFQIMKNFNEFNIFFKEDIYLKVANRALDLTHLQSD